jgi:hypothetical protein
MRDLHRASAAAGNHALAMRSREPGPHKLNHLCDGEAMREHDRLGAAVPAGSEQLKRSASVRLHYAVGMIAKSSP